MDRAGSRDDDDDEPEEPKEPYKVTMDETSTVTDITVGTSEGLSQILSGTAAGGSEEEKNALTQAYTNGFEGVTITLSAGNYNISSTFGSEGDPFLGTLTGQKGSTTINIQAGSNGLFAQIGMDGGGSTDNGRVENITFDVQTEIKNTYSALGYVCAGAVAGQNNGTITNCDVKLNNSTIKIEKVSGPHRAGGIVGQNDGKITGCTVTGGTIQVESQPAFAGGIVGHNDGKITGCTVTGATIIADGSSGGSVAGGLVGRNNGGEITGRCEVKDTSVTAQTNSFGAYAGGLVGDNILGGTVTGTYTYTGSGTLTAKTGFGDYDEYIIATVSVPNSESSYTDTVVDILGNMAYAGTGIGYDFTSKPQGPQPADNHKTISP